MTDSFGPVTLDNCDQEPIHIPGSIQPHGVMLVCDPVTFAIRHASLNLQEVTGNLQGVTGHSGDTFPNLTAEDVLGRAALHDLRNALTKANAMGTAGVLMDMQLPGTDTRFDAMIHMAAGHCIIELEPVAPTAPGDSLDLTRQLIVRIGRETETDRLLKLGARLVQASLGYDRVMIYRFLHNNAGRVVAEARTPNLGSFMGQHFPASDIPAQARRLYLENPIRMIGDATYAPVPLVPPLAPGQPPIDMSHAQLRSVSPIHCEYLRNMGVGGSLSISLIIRGELWGLITCHHYSPKVTPLVQRISAELFGHYLALQIAATEHQGAMAASAEVRARLDALVAEVSEDGPLISSLPGRLPMLARMIGCDGAALIMDGTSFLSGTAPSREQCEDLILALASTENPKRDLWHSQDIRQFIPDTPPPLAGVMAIPLSQLHNDYLLFFRNEEAHQVEWAGEPVKSTANPDRLSPRGSFETWREDVRGKAVPWTETDITIAKAMRAWLRDVILRQNEASAEEVVLVEQRRRILNSELNHRVKNVIALVKSIALQTGQSASTVEEYTAALEGRLQALAVAHDQSLGERAGSLCELIEAEIGLHRSAGAVDRILAKGPALRLDERAFAIVAMVMHEMATNAAKYGALAVTKGRLRVTWRPTPAGDLLIEWRESGGPPVVAPTRTGFGSRLIRSSMEYDLKGTIDLDYDPAGLFARFTVPGQHVQFGINKPEPERPAAPQEDRPLEGLTVLVLEDQGLIAMDVEETLRGLGASDVRLAASPDQAFDLLAEFEPDFALLDFSLGETTSEQIALHLQDIGLPLIFMTGYSDSVMMPDTLRHLPLIRKPINATAISLHVAAVQEKRRPG